MSAEQNFNFNDLNDFCDKMILKTQKWRDVLVMLTEEYTNLFNSNENACAKLWEIHQKVNTLGYLQEKMQQDLNECECNYNVMLQRVEELENSMIQNENCVNSPHYSVYQTVPYLNNSLNNLEAFIENVDARVNEQEDDLEGLNDLSSCALVISKQLQLLESVERKMYYLCNEIKNVEELRKMIVEEIVEGLNRANSF